MNCISSSRDEPDDISPLTVVLSGFGSCLGEHIVRISWVQLPVIDRIHYLAASTPVLLKTFQPPLLWRSLNLRQGLCCRCVCLFHGSFLQAEKKEDSTITCRNQERIFFIQENKSSRTVCSLKWKKMGNISQPEEAFMQSGVCSKLGLSYFEGLSI